MTQSVEIHDIEMPDITPERLHRKRRRAFDSVFLDIEPYSKVLKRSTASLMLLSDPRRECEPHEALSLARAKDFLWISFLRLYSESMVKGWVGWNASLFKINESPKHKVWYLPQINQSPTSNAVIKETLHRSITIAD